MKIFITACSFSLLSLLVMTGCKEKRPEKVIYNTPPKNLRIVRISGEQGEVRPSAVQKWLQFRGAGSAGSVKRNLEIGWDNNNGVVWSSQLPGRGASSPIAIGDKVFVTSASGYGKSAQERGNIDQLRHHLMCFHLGTGKCLWVRDIKGTGLSPRLNENIFRHGFASSTPVTDSETVFAFFGGTGVFAFDLDGELKWQADVGFRSDEFGSSASLVTFNDLLIVNASVESNTLFAIDKKTGKGVWRVEGIDRSWSMPVIGKNQEGKYEMVVMEEDFVRGFDPETGEELWHCEGVHNYVVATPVIHGGICFCNGGIQKQTMAIKLGGSGDVTETHKMWEVPIGSNVSSPVYLTGQLYLISDNGILQVLDSKTGKLVNKVRLPTKSRFYSSPLCAGNSIFSLLEDGGLYVCEANADAKEVTHNRFAGENASLKSSVSVMGQSLLVRSDDRLYKIMSDSELEFEHDLANIDSQSPLIETPVRYEYNPATKRTRLYNLYLDRNPEICRRIILAPYKSVITEEQTEASNKMIKDQYGVFETLKQDQRNAYWEFLKGGSSDAETLETELKRIEKAAETHANQIRVEIKKLFSKEQMDQHLAEAAERRAAAKKAAEEKRAAEKAKEGEGQPE